jgi:Arc/MetJ family transcription regulator
MCITDCIDTHLSRYKSEIQIVRTNIVIDDKVMRAALRETGLKTKREAVEHAPRTWFA